MLRVMAIVCISSSAASSKHGDTPSVKRLIAAWEKITAGRIHYIYNYYMLHVNNFDSIMTCQLCNEIETDSKTNYIENTFVVIAPLIPWSIAGAVPLASISAPTSSILMACFLYILQYIRL